MAKKNLKFKENDIVLFTGNTCYKTSFSKKPIECTSGSAIVVKTSQTAHHSYLLHAPEGSDSDVNGWVNIRDVEEYSEKKEDKIEHMESELDDQIWEEMNVPIVDEEEPVADEPEAPEVEASPQVLTPVVGNVFKNEKKYHAGKNEPYQCIMTNSTCYLEGQNMIPCGIIWHSTGINNPQLSNFVQPKKEDDWYEEMINILGRNEYGNDYNHTQKRDGTHFWIGKDKYGKVLSVQTLPFTKQGWSCGHGMSGSLNHGWIQINLCEDNLDDIFYFQDVYDEACQLTAYICDLFEIDPQGEAEVQDFAHHKIITVPTILCHQDAADLDLASNRVDIYHWFNKFGITMDKVREDVAKLANPIDKYKLRNTTILSIQPEEKVEEEEESEDKEG